MVLLAFFVFGGTDDATIKSATANANGNLWAKVSVIPANNVYYEDTFVTDEETGTAGIVYSGSWTEVTKNGDKTEDNGQGENAEENESTEGSNQGSVHGWEDTLAEFEKALKKKPSVAVFTHVSNVFGYILPVEEMATLCQRYGVPFIIDAAQSAGMRPVSLNKLGADFIAMPGHKGLLGPQGTGILLCNRLPRPLMAGGTGSESMNQQMPEYLPDRAEAGTLNVPGIAGLQAGMRYVRHQGVDAIAQREQYFAGQCIRLLENRGFKVFSGEHQSGTVSFLPDGGCGGTDGSADR